MWDQQGRSGDRPTPPEVARSVYVGSTQSDVFHNPHCFWAGRIHAENLIGFSSRGDAHGRGYRACMVCKP